MRDAKCFNTLPSDLFVANDLPSLSHAFAYILYKYARFLPALSCCRRCSRDSHDPVAVLTTESWSSRPICALLADRQPTLAGSSPPIVFPSLLSRCKRTHLSAPALIASGGTLSDSTFAVNASIAPFRPPQKSTGKVLVRCQHNHCRVISRTAGGSRRASVNVAVMCASCQQLQHRITKIIGEN